MYVLAVVPRSAAGAPPVLPQYPSGVIRWVALATNGVVNMVHPPEDPGGILHADTLQGARRVAW